MSILDRVAEFLTTSVSVAEDDQGLRWTHSDGAETWTVSVETRERLQQLMFYSTLGFEVPDARRAAVAEFITRANSGLIIGNFEMNFHDGVVRFKTSVDVEGTEVTAALCKPLLEANVAMMTTYVPGLRAVALEDEEPVRAIDRIENPEKSSPSPFRSDPEDWEQAKLQAAERVGADPSDWEARFVLARCEEQDDIAKAWDLYATLIVDKPSDLEARMRRLDLTAVHIKHGILEEKYIQAGKEDATALRENPDVGQVLELLHGNCEVLATGFQAHKRYAEALAYWDYLISESDDNPTYLQRRARCHYFLGNYAESIADATRLIEHDPKRRVAWGIRAQSRQAAGDLAGAAADGAREDAIFDYDISGEERVELARILAADKDENLRARYTIFSRKAAKAEQDFGFVKKILGSGWSINHYPSQWDQPLDLTYSVGFFYRTGQPDVMVVSEGIPPEEITESLNVLGRDLLAGRVLAAGDSVTLCGRSVRLENRNEEVDHPYAYGFGGSFYANFMNRAHTPLLMARLVLQPQQE